MGCLHGSTQPPGLYPCDADVQGDTVSAGSIRIVDLNNDGLSDIVGGDFNCSMDTFKLNTGNGFSTRITMPTNLSDSFNIELSDYNQDGYVDLIGSKLNSIRVYYWDSALNKFSSNYSDVSLQGFYGYQDNFTLKDLNGDGSVDLFLTSENYESSIPVRQRVQINKSIYRSSNKIKEIVDGLGHKRTIRYEALSRTQNYSRIKGVNPSAAPENICRASDILGGFCWQRTNMANSASSFYAQVNDPAGSLPNTQQRIGLETLYPVFNVIGSMQVVTEVSESYPTADDEAIIDQNDAKFFEYYYEQAQLQAAGRGFLGFKKFTVFDYQSGIRIINEFRQDWPFAGRLLKSEKYAGLTLLNRTENTWGLVDCYSGLTAVSACITTKSNLAKTQGTKAIGSVQPFIAKTTITNFYLNTTGGSSLENVIESKKIFDLKGNNLYEIVSTGHGSSPLYTVETTNSYIYPSYSYSGAMGRLDNTVMISAQYGALGSDSIRQEVNFGYYSSGPQKGLLEYDIVEPNNSEYTIRTNHTYNNFGLKIGSETSAHGQTRKGTELEYDAYGRYVDKTYEYFTIANNSDVASRHLASSVLTRDKYGTPTKSINYLEGTGITTIAATSAFGEVYFTANSRGEYSKIDVGVNQDNEGICPIATKVWKKISSAGGKIIIYCVDISGKIIREATAGFSAGQWNIVDSGYNRSGFLYYKSEPYKKNESPYYTYYNEYDSLGRVKTIFAPTRQQDGIVPLTSIRYEHNQTEITNPKGQVQTEYKNILGQVMSVSNSINGITSFGYDARGNLISMSDPNGNNTALFYDLLGRKISMNDPDKGSWSYRYNRFNELICIQDAKNQTIIQNYDIRGRLINRKDRSVGTNCSDASLSSTAGTITDSYWVYDRASNGRGKLQKTYAMRYGAMEYTQRYTYDKYGRQIETETSFKGHLNTLDSHHEKFTYDQYSRPFQVFDAARSATSYEYNGVQYTYNARGYLSSIRDAIRYGGQAKTYYTINAMDARGNITSAISGNNTTTTANFYPDNGFAKDIHTYTTLGISLQNLQLKWDVAGNLQSRRETGGGTWIENYLRSRNINESFEYDDLNRLTHWNTTGDFNATESVTYDAIDNIRTKTGSAVYLYGNQCSSSANAGPHAACNVGGATYSYDKNGNLTSDGTGRNFQYMIDDLPSQISKNGHTTRFQYGPDRSRFKRVDTTAGSTTTTLYIGNVEKIYRSDNTVEWKRYISGVAVISQTYNSVGILQSTKENYLHRDHLGSLNMITDANGFVVKDFYYDPWGASRVPTNDITQWVTAQPFQKVASTISSRGFTDHEHLDEVGLIHMNGRIYDPKLARFVQADPIIQDPLRVQSLNRYSYVWNNPLNATDPSGFMKQGMMPSQMTDEPVEEKEPEKIEEVIVTGHIRWDDFSAFDNSEYISDSSYSVEWAGDGYNYESSSGSGRGLYGNGNAQKAHELAELLWPGYDFGTCLSQGGCSTLTWGVAVVGIIPGGKVAALGVKGTVKSIKFGQANVKNTFSHGPFKGRTIGDVADGLRSGTISPDALPIEYIVRNGDVVALNNRSLTALRRSGMEPTRLQNRTGDLHYEKILDDHLRGGFPSDFIRIRGSGSNTSLIE